MSPQQQPASLMDDIQTLQKRLGHVFWLGGSPCSGKSSIAAALVEKYGLQYYTCDDAFFQHAKLVRPSEQPVFHRIIHLSPEALWMRPPSVLLKDEIACYHEEFPLILHDLLALPADRPILAEGAALLPERVAPLLLDQRHAMWVVPTRAFQWTYYSQREWAREVVKDCSDPAQAFANWMERDVRFARSVRRKAVIRGLTTLVVDGKKTLAENTAFVEAHFIGSGLY
jgi:hypothetical protein